MSAEADVAEMQTLCGEIADRLAGPGAAAAKHRVYAVKDALVEVTLNRAMEFLLAKARIIHSWEKDRARHVLRKLKEQDARAEAARLVANLNRTAAYLRSIDPDQHQHDIAALERTLSLAGVLDRALAETTD
jgi:hypothetical protein